MMGFHPKKPVKMREKERDYEEWFDRQKRPNEIVEIMILLEKMNLSKFNPGKLLGWMN